MSLENQHALVTGGNGGIGKPLVARMIAAGMKVTVADIFPPDKDTAAAMIPVDLSRPDFADELGASFSASPPDILVNLAGLMAFQGFETMDPVRLQSLMQLNLLTPMQLAHALLPAMVARGSGHIVNIGSMLAGIPLPYFAAYTASKSGIEGFSDALRREVGGRGICVTYIAPRAVRTPMNDGPLALFNERSGTKQDMPERVADVILDAIANRRGRVTIGFPEKLFAKVNGLFPQLLDRALVRNRRLAEDVLAAQTT